jgi:type IV fimbrial biogenesis protein FimT
MDRQTGFTVIELMIAVALSAILLSMAVPAMNTFVSNSRQTGTVNDFLASMHMARSTAITMNTRVTVCPSSDAQNCEAVSWDEGWIVFTDGDSDQSVDVGETMVSTSAGGDGLSIASAEFGDFLMFRPNGRAMNATLNENSGQFTVCDHRGASHAKVLIVDLSGRPRISDKKMDGSAPGCG